MPEKEETLLRCFKFDRDRQRLKLIAPDAEVYSLDFRTRSPVRIL
jgi:hypothetical protein